MKLLFLDTETTGLGSEDRLIQVAYAVPTEELFIAELFKPPVPLGIEAMCVNHITEKMLADAPEFQGSSVFLDLEERLANNYLLVAHNAPFDIEMLRREGLHVPRYICTKKVAKHLDLAPKLNLQYLRYSLGIEVPDAVAHSADGDVRVLVALFEHLEQHLPIEKMLELC